jgi:hypothetical protein
MFKGIARATRPSGVAKKVYALAKAKRCSIEGVMVYRLEKIRNQNMNLAVKSRWYGLDDKNRIRCLVK